MITGRDNLQLINQHLQQAQTAQEEAGRRLGELHRHLDALRRETGERYRELARLRLDDLQASQLVSRLDETDQDTLKLLEKLKQARLDLQERIKANISRKQQLEEQRKELERRRDEAGEGVQRQLEQTRKRVTETDAYRKQQERVQEVLAVARQADEKASQTEKDQLEKGKPYEADSLFMYLWKRRYLMPNYQAGWLGRRLDNWVAKHIDFQRNRANYHMLQELPRRLREHATKAQQTAQLEAQALQTMERQAAEADGILALQTGAQDAEKQLKQHDALIEAEEVRYRQLLQEQTGFNEATDPLSKQVIDLQVAALQREELTELLREARTTPRPEDDMFVARLQQVQQQQTQIGAEIQSINQFLLQQQRNLAELEELRRRYRQNGYDAYNSSFPGDFALGTLLGQVLGGLMNSDMAWQELGRHHRSSQPPGDWGGFGGGSREPGDETGGFGGGDFRTGGGF
jgi:hypothetical protein